MPLIQVKYIKETFTPAQKKEIITKRTDAMVSIEGENLRLVTGVTIEEICSGEWEIGGQPITMTQFELRQQAGNESSHWRSA